MADFQRAFTIQDRDTFIAARLDKLRAVAVAMAQRGNPHFLARQHAFFLHAYADCKCKQHSCSGCAITLGVASALEKDIEQMDPPTVDREEAKASAMWARVWQEWREWVRIASVRAQRMKEEREQQSARTRRASIRRDAKEDQAS